jgi:hypothetical protein
MQRDLMPEEVEINPSVGAAALRTAKRLPIKGAYGRQIIDVIGKVKNAHGAMSCDGFTQGIALCICKG